MYAEQSRNTRPDEQSDEGRWENEGGRVKDDNE